VRGEEFVDRVDEVWDAVKDAAAVDFVDDDCETVIIL